MEDFWYGMEENCQYGKWKNRLPFHTMPCTPVVKDRNGDTESYQNYRPISNLCFVAKLLEKVIYEQIQGYITINNLHAKFQSGYRKHYSFETAIVKVVRDIQQNVNATNSALIVMLDLSSAFDTIDQDILIHRLHHDYAFSGHVLNWIKSYLSDRSFSVLCE